MKNNDEFVYTYSAKKEQEIQRIREKYTSKENDVYSQLLKLDKECERKGVIIALVLGIVGCLFFGVGLSCIMLYSNIIFIVGIGIGIIGLVCMALAYPMFDQITKKQRKLYLPRIEELLKKLDEINAE